MDVHFSFSLSNIVFIILTSHLWFFISHLVALMDRLSILDFLICGIVSVTMLLSISSVVKIQDVNYFHTNFLSNLPYIFV